MTWVQTASGKAFDLIQPSASDVDFTNDVAPALSRIARFAGQVASGPYSVAQHCVIGADAIMEETGDPVTALGFLLHDAHEAYIGDLTGPALQAMCVEMTTSARYEMPEARHRMAALRARVDAAIYGAAEALWPLNGARILDIKLMDQRMLETERRQLLTPCSRRWSWDNAPPRPIRLRGGLRVWPWPQACERWLDRLRQWSPAFQ